MPVKSALLISRCKHSGDSAKKVQDLGVWESGVKGLSLRVYGCGSKKGYNEFVSKGKISEADVHGSVVVLALSSR